MAVDDWAVVMAVLFYLYFHLFAFSVDRFLHVVVRFQFLVEWMHCLNVGIVVRNNVIVANRTIFNWLQLL
jgi:hypothetical protein